MKVENEKAAWTERLKSLGRIQARYLWLLLLVSLLLLSLDGNLRGCGALNPIEAADDQRAEAVDQLLDACRVGEDSALSLPLLELAVSVPTVWLSGPLVIGTLILILLGSIAAAGVAADATDRREPVAGDLADVADSEPNGLDLAFYLKPSTRRRHPAAAKLLGYNYLALLLLPMAFAIWMSWTALAGILPDRSAFPVFDGTGRLAFHVLAWGGAAVLVLGAARLLVLAYERLKRRKAQEESELERIRTILAAEFYVPQEEMNDVAGKVQAAIAGVRQEVKTRQPGV